ncbi:two-component sensor histidine kinase [Streptomyces inusitatus]|uniref:histidine kinase n=1 Tax=Streptomyces inusitatus TaxID=68221 RepID=A0A918QKR6_9ACTN|nr:histidine kinase [Streptomyces inusitatus]GGZ57420.1 two-component sensor histidine kinase [Streptomyces inusitatus]
MPALSPHPLIRSVTYTRWLHLFIGAVVWGVWEFIDEEGRLAPFALVGLVGLIPAVRLVEGLQARLLLTGDSHRESASRIAAAPSANWADRWRTALWMEVRLALGLLTAYLTAALAGLSFALARASSGADPVAMGALPWSLPGGHWWYALLAPLPTVALLAAVAGLGALITAIARRLLGPSGAERLAALEERTELLLERNRIARELHDSIGHALTVAVVQAGAARAAKNEEFTVRALAAIEETGRAALEDLERVLLILRESGGPVPARPTLAHLDRLLESARASGATVDASVSGPLSLVPGPVSREGYRIAQESLTNVLRHAGPAPIRVHITIADGRLDLEVTNPLPTTRPPAAPGGGLRGIRERAALLGGRATAGAEGGEWRVRVRLPLDFAARRVEAGGHPYA